MPDYPPGTLGILTGDLTRYAWAMASLRAMHVPDNTQITWVAGQWVSRAVNLILDQMRPEDEWVCLMTDDNPAPPDMLLRLLDHNLPLVAPVVCLRIPPFHPAMAHQQEDGSFVSYTWEELAGRTGVLPVASFGGPGVVIRREVIEKVGMPFFENMPGPGGRIAPNEDLYTFHKCRLAGYQPMVDLDIRLGHCVPAILTPDYHPGEGRWGIGVWSSIPLGMLWPGDTP